MSISISRRSFVGLGAAAALSLSLAACGGGSSTDNTAGNANTNASSEGSSSDYTLVTQGVLTVASDLANPPLDYVDDDGVDQGFEVELMQQVAGKLGLTSQYLAPMKFDSIIPLIKQGGKADVGVSNFTITDERKEEIDFSDSYLDSNQGVVTKADSTKTDEDALNASDVKVAVQSGTTGESWVKENLPQAECVTLDDPIVAITGVQSGLYDAAVADLPVVSYLCTNSYTDCRVAIEVPTGEQYGIVVSKDNPGLTQAINQALQELKDDGTIDSLQEKWFGTTL